MTRAVLNCGYVPLVDAAPLVIAHELNFSTEEGIALNLLRQPSWSAVRDLLAHGQLDAAHILSPLPIAMSLGIGVAATQTDALMVLSANGNVIGVSPSLAEAMRSDLWSGRFDTPRETGTALIKASVGRLRIGVPFPHSMHTELFCYWLGALGMDSSSGLEIVTIPPRLMAQAISEDEIDAFCVGEPWGSIAVEDGVAELVLPGRAIWGFAPEKVLGARRDWVDRHPEQARALVRALYRATQWLGDKGNLPLASEVLARSEFLAVPEPVINRALSGQLTMRRGAADTHVPEFLRFHANAANFPWRSQAAWIGARMAARLGIDSKKAIKAARGCFRSDLYRGYLADLAPNLPLTSDKVEGALPVATPMAATKGEVILGPDSFFDGTKFDMSPNRR